MLNKNKSILLFQRILPAYRVGVFKALQNETGIIPCYSREKEGHSLKSDSNSNDLKTELLPSIYPGKSVTFMIQSVYKILIKYKPDIVISEGASSYMTLWLLHFFKPFFRYKIITWSHGIKNREINNPFSSASSRLALWIMKSADAVILYSENRKKVLEKYIPDNNKLFVARNTLDLSSFKMRLDKYKTEGRSEIKKSLGWDSEFNLIYIGRLISSKKVDQLPEILKLIPETFDVSLHIIGDGPEENMLKQKSKGNKRIKFYGAISDDNITGRMLFASDLMIIPGYVGLAVVHAFAYACPVITARYDPVDGPFHSPEFEYIINDKNGLILEGRVNIFVEKIVEMLNNSNILEQMSLEAENTAYHEARIDHFISGFKNAIEFVRLKK